MLLTLLLDPDLSRLGPYVLAGWGLLLTVVILLGWTIQQFFNGHATRVRGIIGLAMAGLLLLIGWQFIGLAVVMTLLY